MSGSGPTVSVTKVSRVKDFQGILKRFDKLQVYVGVPQEKSSRHQVDHVAAPGGGKRPKLLSAMDTKVTNAELLYIHTHGSPLRGIPARPVIEPAILDDKANIAAELRTAGEGALAGDQQQMLTGLRRAGMEGQNAARAWFTSPKNNWSPNKPATVAAKGSSMPLIDSTQLRKAIIWVLGED